MYKTKLKTKYPTYLWGSTQNQNNSKEYHLYNYWNIEQKEAKRLSLNQKSAFVHIFASLLKLLHYFLKCIFKILLKHSSFLH